MKQSLQLKLGQQLTMTPQLQQAIRLLQLSTLDLQQEIQEALESNPMLEVEESDRNNEEVSSDSDVRNEESELRTLQDKEDDWVGQLDTDIAVDTDWNDIFETGQTTSQAAPETEQSLETRIGTQESLHDHLLWQLNLSTISDRDRMIGETLIDAISPSGWIEENFSEIVTSFDPDWDIDEDEVEAVLHLIQHFDPVGVGARNLQECLLIQLRMLPPETPYLEKAILVITDHIEQLGNRDYKLIQKATGFGENQLTDVIHLIQTLHPHPGELIESSEVEYIVPDVFVRKKNNRWAIELNADTAPKLRINPVYAALASRSDSSDEGTYLRNNLQEAKWFLKSLQSRNETLLKVTEAIVKRQRMFLEYGDEAMKPMVLQDIAEAVEMHESTISRVTSRKYMHTPRGIFELKYFFSSHVSTTEGGECSSTAIRALIKKIVSAENPKKPLSDNKIAKLLEEQGIQVARRTIAKYRENLGIPSSSERKRLV